MRYRVFTKWMSGGLLVAIGALALSVPAAAEDKGIIALQQSVSLLMSEVADLQKGFNTQIAVIQSLVTQNTDTVNTLTNRLAAIQAAINGSQVVANQQQNSDAKQFQALADTIGVLEARLKKMDTTLQQIRQMQQTIPPPSGVAQPAGMAPAAGAAGAGMADAAVPQDPSLPPYQRALNDFQNGSPKALPELAAFLRTYPTSPEVPSAEYYLGTIYLQRQQYNEAIDSFSSVIEQYPDNAKTPLAELDKGIAYAKLGNRVAAISELRALSRNYPGTEAARQADIELRSLLPGRRR